MAISTRNDARPVVYRLYVPPFWIAPFPHFAPHHVNAFVQFFVFFFSLLPPWKVIWVAPVERALLFKASKFATLLAHQERNAKRKDERLTGIWTRVPLLKADTVNWGKMGQSLLFLVASGPRCSVLVLSIQLLSGWSKSITGIGSKSWFSFLSLIRLECNALLGPTLGAVCRPSIRALTSSSWSSCRCCWIAFCAGLLNVPTWVWFQFWNNILNPEEEGELLLLAGSGRKASGSLNKSDMASCGPGRSMKDTQLIGSFDLNAFLLFITCGAWAASERAWACYRRNLVWLVVPLHLFFSFFPSILFATPPTRCGSAKATRPVQRNTHTNTAIRLKWNSVPVCSCAFPVIYGNGH